MTLNPESEKHLLQIQAGQRGRNKGHEFELRVSKEINNINFEKFDFCNLDKNKDVFYGIPGLLLLKFISATSFINQKIESACAFSTGSIATAEKDLKREIFINGKLVKKSKSDIVIKIKPINGEEKYFGISTKQCSIKRPTNAQLYFSTAKGFSDLLNRNFIKVPEYAIISLKQFCGDIGFRPLDQNIRRECDPRRYFWEEINKDGREFWEKLFKDKQKEITEILFKKGYSDDPYEPDYLLHKTRKVDENEKEEYAIFSIDQLIKMSIDYQGFIKNKYQVKKGSYKDPENIFHEAPRFGIIQMQRGGQKQHPTQLQFNLEASYFKKIHSSNKT